MAGTVYFGNSRYQTWIKSPASGMDASPIGSSSSQQFLNGGASVRRSTGSHREFNMSWTGSLNNSDGSSDLYKVKDFADGLYGDAPFFWLDPFATNTNVMSPEWASPMLAEKGWATIDTSIVPTFSDTPGTPGSLPYRYASYVLGASYAGTKKFTIILPSTSILSFGWFTPSTSTNASTGAGIRLEYTPRAGGSKVVANPASLTPAGTARFNTNVSGATYSMVEVFIANGAVTSRTLNILGIMAQVNTTAPSNTGSFVPGRGSGKLEFIEPPKINYVSSAIGNGYVEMTAKFVEVV